MSKTLGKNVLRASASALACLALAGADVKAAVMTIATTSTAAVAPVMAPVTPTTPSSETFSTTGSIGTVGVSNSNGDVGPGPVGFTQITTGSFGLNSQVSLGAFAVSTLSDNSTTTYANTPFTITYNPLSVGGDNFPNAPITISGVLNGSVSGNQSSVVAKFNTINSPVFQTADGTYLSSISIANNPLSLVPSTTFAGLTSIQATVTTTAAAPGTLPPPLGTPEPTALAILATSLVGLGLRQRLRARSGRQSA